MNESSLKTRSRPKWMFKSVLSMTTHKEPSILTSLILSLMFVMLSVPTKCERPSFKTEHNHLTADSDSIFGNRPTKKSTVVHFYTGVTRWNKQIFAINELIKESEIDLGLSIFGSNTGSDRETNGILSDKPVFEMLIDFSKVKIAGSPLSFGLGYERFHFSQSGFLDVEKIQQGIFKNEYIGESIVLSNDLNSVYIIGAFTLQKYNTAHPLGYSIHIVTSMMYTHLRETEDVTMQTDLMQNNSTGAFEYKKENFLRTVFADLYSMEAGVRFEWHASAYFSLIFPQVTYRRTLYREAIPSKTYTSFWDGDQLVMPERMNGLNSLFFMCGLGVHFYILSLGSPEKQPDDLTLRFESNPCLYLSLHRFSPQISVICSKTSR